MANLSASTIAAIAAAVAEALAAERAAVAAERAARRAERVESPAQVTWKHRTAGTCPDCGRADFRTLNGFATHALSADGAPCAVTDARKSAVAAQAAK